MRTHLVASTKYARSDSPPLWVIGEVFGETGQWVMDRITDGLYNAVGLHTGSNNTSLSVYSTDWLKANDVSFEYWAMPSSVGNDIPTAYPTTVDDNAPAIMNDVKAGNGGIVWRLIMTEPDQTGGTWSIGRPSLSGLTDAQAYDSFRNYLLTTRGMSALLGSSTPGTRGFPQLVQICYGVSAFYMFEMGLDTVVIERLSDELPDVISGICYLRGAAKQYGGKQWGVDISGYRTWSMYPDYHAATYNMSTGALIAGWSRDTIKRVLYAASGSGADIVHLEANTYYLNSGLNDYGLAIQEWSDCVITRHPERGHPVVPMAVVMSHKSGFEPNVGEWLRWGYKWQFQNLYLDGDRMTERAWALIYPNYADWGRIVAGAPWRVDDGNGVPLIPESAVEYRAEIAASADTRPWEPHASTRYGCSVDMLTDNVGIDALKTYKVVMITATTISTDFWAVLAAYVAQGGNLIVSTAQLPTGHGTVSGLSALGSTSTASASIWTADTSTITEASGFTYRLVTLGAATNMATASGNSVVTRNAHGSGFCYVLTPLWGLNTSGTTMLLVVQKLLDQLYAAAATVTVSTATNLQYFVSRGRTSIVVTMINTNLANSAYTGTLSFPMPPSTYLAEEWRTDASVSTSVVNGRVEIAASVPAYDVRVYVLDWGPGSANANRLPAEDAGFETTAGTWATYTNCTVARSTAQAATGVGSLAVTVTTGGVNAVAGTGQTTDGAGFTPVTAGQSYTVTLKSRAATTACYFVAEVVFYSAANITNWVAAHGGAGEYNTTSGWTTDTLTDTVPATATHARVHALFYLPVADGEVHYVDDVTFVGGV